MKIFILLYILIFLVYTLVTPSGNLKISILNVGQGDSIFISNGDKNFLIDSGNDDSLLYEISKELFKGSITLDIVLLTHFHEDHYGGIYSLLDKVNINYLVFDFSQISSDNKFHDICNRVNCIDLYKKNLTDICFSRDVCIKLLNPGCNSSNLNNCSIVSVISFKKHKFLFMGDAEFEEESWLISNYAELIKNVFLLKAGHHCSNTSTSKELLMLTNPQKVVCSVGKNNRFNHPGNITLDNLKAFSKEPLFTWNGSITITCDMKKFLCK